MLDLNILTKMPIPVAKKVNSAPIEVDPFKKPDVRPSCALSNYLLLFDNFNGVDALLPLTGNEVRLSQMTVFLVLTGTSSFEINGKNVDVTAGQCLITMPETVLKYIHATEDIRYVLWVVYPNLLTESLADIDINYNKVELSTSHRLTTFTIDEQKYYRSLYCELKDDLILGGYDRQNLYVRCYMNVLFANITHLFKTDHMEKPATASYSRQYDLYRRFLNMLNKDAATHREVKYYADGLNITSKYLSSLTLQYSKKNASAWIDDYVITKAKSLMTVEHLDVHEVCERLNFPSPSSFSRFFKRVTDMTPKEFMKGFN